MHDEDLKKWELPAACFANLTDVDKRKGQAMLSMPALQAKPTWRCAAFLIHTGSS